MRLQMFQWLKTSPSRRIAFRCLTNDAKVGYDLVVIGGGSAGLACSKQASELGAEVLLVDAVESSPHGTVWGIGGTCVNVGCIPKKLMHLAALNGDLARSCHNYGWDGVGDLRLNWSTLISAVQDKIKAANWIYRVQLRNKKVDYLNAFASFEGERLIKLVGAGRKKFERIVEAKTVVLATGLRPKYPNIAGAHLGITSDDLFSLKKSPQKTLVVGSSYVGLECAGFLNSLCCDTTLAIRSIPLRGFDQQCADIVLHDLALRGVKIKRYVQPTEVSQNSNGDLKVSFRSIDGETISTETFNTVLWAVGREPKLSTVKPHNVGLKISRSGKIIVNAMDKTSVDWIYALGDVAEGRPELSPPAIKAGQLLAQRLFGKSSEVLDYKTVPTTVFTPLEYSSVGLSEELAIVRFGEENLDIFHAYHEPYEFVIPRDESRKNCYTKVISERDPSGQIRGIHFIGTNAAEVMQGYAAAMNAKITRKQLFSTMPIHPCSSEEIIKMTITKRSGVSPTVASCCG